MLVMTSKGIIEFIHDVDKIERIRKNTRYLLRRISGELNMVVKCLKVTEKGILFECDDDGGYENLLGKTFWVPKSIILVEKFALPKSQVYYIPKSTVIKFCK